MKKTALPGKTIYVLLHIMAWTVLVILPQLLIDRYWGNNYFAWTFYLNAAAYGLIFYINYLWLVPRLFLEGKKIRYFLLALVVIVFLYFISDFINDHYIHNPLKEKAISEFFDKMVRENVIPRPPRQLHVYYFSLISIMITGFSLGLKVLERHTASEKRQKELEKEKLNSELAFLKNQISPHFFFNTLNNIYSLIEVNTGDAQEAVLKLSKMMRYLLYESEHGETLLSHEIGFMNHYIDLMKLRLSPKVELKINFPEKYADCNIPPLLFIPFIENAFKHGVSYREKSFIHISMEIAGDILSFTCENSLGNPANEKSIKKYSGIGLENVKKRLSLLFGENHNLEIGQSDNLFFVKLGINLKNKKND